MEKAKINICSDLSLYIVFHGVQNMPDVNVLILKGFFSAVDHLELCSVPVSGVSLEGSYRRFTAAYSVLNRRLFWPWHRAIVD